MHTVALPYNEILLSGKNGQTNDIHKSMDESQIHYAG